MRSFDSKSRRVATIASVLGVAGVLGATALVAASGGASADAEPSSGSFEGPFLTVFPPGPTIFPPFTIVPGTFITVPGFTLVTLVPATTILTTTTAATTTSTTTSTTPASTEPDSTSVATTDGNGELGTDEIPPHLEITAASIDCAGLLHLEYFTEAQPEPAPAIDHVIILSPLANPAAIAAQQLIDRPTNGAWVFDVPAPSLESYRIAVVADFQPDDIDGVLLVDEAEAVLPTDCPTG